MLTLDRSWTDEIWQSPYRLRFELSGGESYVSMFTSAYDRARQLARAILPDQPLAIIADFASPSWAIRAISGDFSSPTQSPPFATLEAMGVSTDTLEATWNGYWYPGDAEDSERTTCEHRALLVSWDEADILLWNNLAQDIGVEPRPSAV